MKRLMTLLMAVMFGVVLFTAPMFADPGDETNTDGTTSADTTAVWTALAPAGRDDFGRRRWR